MSSFSCRRTRPNSIAAHPICGPFAWQGRASLNARARGGCRSDIGWQRKRSIWRRAVHAIIFCTSCDLRSARGVFGQRRRVRRVEICGLVLTAGAVMSWHRLIRRLRCLLWRGFSVASATPVPGGCAFFVWVDSCDQRRRVPIIIFGTAQSCPPKTTPKTRRFPRGKNAP